MSSTAPYFVDDRLYCPEEDMQECKPVHLCVSLVPEEVLTPTNDQSQKNRIELQANVGASLRTTPQSTPLVGVKTDVHATDKEGAASRAVVTHGNSGNKNNPEDGESVVHGPASATQEAMPTRQIPEGSASIADDEQATPWVLDICLVRVSSVGCCAKLSPL